MKPFQSNPRGNVRRAVGIATLSFLGAGAGACESTTMPMTGKANLFLMDANNYTSTSKLTVPRIETVSGTDMDICWGGVTKDIQCHDLAPMKDLDYVGLLRFRDLSEAQVQDKLTAGQVVMSDLDGYLEVRSDHTKTCAKLKDFSFFTTPIKVETEYVESNNVNNYTYMMIFGHGEELGVGARSMTFLKPLVASTNVKVDGPSGCGLLDFHANLTGVTPLPVKKTSPWIVDWRQVTKDGQGNAINFPTIDGVMIGFYKGMTVQQLQDDIFDLEQNATALYEYKFVGAKSADLAMAKERTSGAAFTGFEPTDGVWILGLRCSTCQNPAPVVLTIVNPT